MKLPQGIKDSDKRLEFQTPPKTYTLFHGKNYLRALKSLDSKDLSISLWVKIMDSSMFGDQILVGNRYFGCLKKMEAFGYLIFLSREDETTFTLNVIIHSTSNGCETLSVHVPIQEVDRWMHVGVVFTSEGKKNENELLTSNMAHIYINGVKKLSNFITRYINMDQPFSFGVSNDNKAPLFGALSTVAIWNSSLTEGELFLLSRGGELAESLLKTSTFYFSLDPEKIESERKGLDDLPLQIVNIQPPKPSRVVKKLNMKSIKQTYEKRSKRRHNRTRTEQKEEENQYSFQYKSELRYHQLLKRKEKPSTMDYLNHTMVFPTIQNTTQPTNSLLSSPIEKKTQSEPTQYVNKNKPSMVDIMNMNDEEESTTTSQRASEDTQEDLLSQQRVLEQEERMKQAVQNMKFVTRTTAEKDNEESPAPPSKSKSIPILPSLSTAPSTATTYEDFVLTMKATPSLTFSSGDYAFKLPSSLLPDYQKTLKQRKRAVEQMMSHAWNGYKTFAWGRDEMRPVSGGSRDNWGDIAMNLLDSLDVLYLMKRKTDLESAREYIDMFLTFEKNSTVSVFETNIRALGGLLSIYQLTEDSLYLEKAKDLGDRLLLAFDSPSKFPHAKVHLSSGNLFLNTTKERIGLAEFGTLSLEFRTLSYYTKNSSYACAVNYLYDQIANTPSRGGLYPIFFDIQTGKPHGNALSVGSMGDSFYEYLLKAYLHNNKQEPELLRLYHESVRGTRKQLMRRSTVENYLYIGRTIGSRLFHEMTHLSCFYSGLLVLGIYHNVTEDAERDLQDAKSLAYTCYHMFMNTPTHLSPEVVKFPKGNQMKVSSENPEYLLRPELIESLFLLYQYTRDPIYVEWGWDVFQAINSTCYAEHGYGIYRDVRQPGHLPEDRTETFLFSEVIKYFYMLFNPTQTVDLTQYVLSTEAHLFKIHPDAHYDQFSCK